MVNEGLTRREFLRNLGVLSLAASVAPKLIGCSGGSGSSKVSSEGSVPVYIPPQERLPLNDQDVIDFLTSNSKHDKKRVTLNLVNNAFEAAHNTQIDHGLKARFVSLEEMLDIQRKHGVNGVAGGLYFKDKELEVIREDLPPLDILEVGLHETKHHYDPNGLTKEVYAYAGALNLAAHLVYLHPRTIELSMPPLVGIVGDTIGRTNGVGLLEAATGSLGALAIIALQGNLMSINESISLQNLGRLLPFVETYLRGNVSEANNVVESAVRNASDIVLFDQVIREALDNLVNLETNRSGLSDSDKEELGEKLRNIYKGIYVPARRRESGVYVCGGVI